jgi:hypothetical protein
MPSRFIHPTSTIVATPAANYITGGYPLFLPEEKANGIYG